MAQIDLRMTRHPDIPDVLFKYGMTVEVTNAIDISDKIFVMQIGVRQAIRVNPNTLPSAIFVKVANPVDMEEIPEEPDLPNEQPYWRTNEVDLYFTSVTELEETWTYIQEDVSGMLKAINLGLTNPATEEFDSGIELRPWTPYDIIDTLLMWTIADGLGEFSLGPQFGSVYPVNTWFNRGSGNDFVPVSGSPYTDLGGTNVIFQVIGTKESLFAGSGVGLSGDPAFSAVMALNTPGSVPPGEQHYLAFGNNQFGSFPPTETFIEMGISNAKWRVFGVEYDNVPTSVESVPPYLFGASRDSGDAREQTDVFFNGTQMSPGVFGATDPVNLSNQVYIGSDAAGLNYGTDLSIYEIIVSTDNSTETRQKIEGYMAHRYNSGLQASHPYYYEPPMVPV